MNNKTMLFHYPGSFFQKLDTGEKKRPLKMLNAFQELGFDITQITGSRSERTERYSAIKNHLDQFDFLYSENSNIPLGLCGNKHLPAFNSVDYQLFKEVSQAGIPSGVFYRDFYWLYAPFRKELGFFKRVLGIPFYKSEVKLYSQYATSIFVPSERCRSWLPSVDQEKLVALPPGENIHPIEEKVINNSLNLLYVGSIQPPKYDLSSLVNSLVRANKNRQVHLTLITRLDDWENYSSYYSFPDFVEYKVASGDDLEQYYRKSDIALYYLTPDLYAEIRLPVKLFEAIGYGLPIISYGDNAVGDFIKDNHVGWVVDENSNDNIFEYLFNHPEEIQEKRNNVLKIREEHTWKRRAEEVVETLLRPANPSSLQQI